MARARLWWMIGIAVVLEVFIIASYYGRFLDEDKEPTPGKNAEEGAVVAAIFPLVLVLLALFVGFDGFSLGSAVVAAVLETVIFTGWVKSPQDEPFFPSFVGATVFPLILLFVTFLFYYLQRDG